MSRIALISVIATLILVLPAAPAGAQEPPTGAGMMVSPSLVSGVIVPPAGATLPADAVVLVSVDDTSRADAPAVTLARLVMQGPGASSPIPFALSVLPAALEAHPPVGPLGITLLVRIESSGGELLYINDTAIGAVDASGPLPDLLVPVVAVGA